MSRVHTKTDLLKLALDDKTYVDWQRVAAYATYKGHGGRKEVPVFRLMQEVAVADILIMVRDLVSTLSVAMKTTGFYNPYDKDGRFVHKVFYDAFAKRITNVLEDYKIIAVIGRPAFKRHRGLLPMHIQSIGYDAVKTWHYLEIEDVKNYDFINMYYQIAEILFKHVEQKSGERVPVPPKRFIDYCYYLDM